MERVHITQIDNKLFFPVPESLENELSITEDYTVIKKEDGVVCFIPTIEEIYNVENYTDGELYLEEELPNSIDGGEIV